MLQMKGAKLGSKIYYYTKEGDSIPGKIKNFADRFNNNVGIWELWIEFEGNFFDDGPIIRWVKGSKCQLQSEVNNVE